MPMVSVPKKLTSLNGYACAAPLSHKWGSRLLSSTLKARGGGGPLMSAPMTTGVIDIAVHNQRIAVLDVASGQLRPGSALRKIFTSTNYDWSPDDKTFVANGRARTWR